MQLTNPITFENSSDLTKTLTESSGHQKMVFDVKNVKAYNINSFFFQRVATNILTFAWQNNNKSLCFALAKDDRVN
jgi:hypothetical protein